ncbi:uncharacterized protein MYCFIDRAFT_172781 [Pseudocercospora fijiensis CIRAD86]|uniref:Uncharacterized protein n=1 Tax=Pseudocercospora fijiensis (strain CIRAD86) TaxID=383855 RepID=M3BCW8_PSEFD|nr:uncharacterized protein MYCFIDRAFT_172781 [Pseudocercospora fijiensis CIRAD86]EME87117.1 hypothetical protein MYCFIDRAFT_172781 [Pseudocercospora fijiensis CIRAD86]
MQTHGTAFKAFRATTIWDFQMPEVKLLSGDDENSTLWQFILAGPETSRAVYALRSASSSGLYCLFTSGERPVAVPCGSNSGQVQAFYASTEGGADDGVVLVPYPNSASRAFSADGDSSEGDEVEFDELKNFQDASVDLLWAIQSQGVVDTIAYPPISATYTGDSSPSTSALTTSTSIAANTTSPAASTTAVSTSTSTTSSPVVVTAADGSTIPVPTGTPSKSLIASHLPNELKQNPLTRQPTESSETPTSPSLTTLTVTTDLPAATTEATTPAESSESASASQSVEVSDASHTTSSWQQCHDEKYRKFANSFSGPTRKRRPELPVLALLGASFDEPFYQLGHYVYRANPVATLFE